MDKYEIITIMGFHNNQKVSAVRKGGMTTFGEALVQAKRSILAMGSHATDCIIYINKNGRLAKFYYKRHMELIVKEGS